MTMEPNSPKARLKESAAPVRIAGNNVGKTIHRCKYENGGDYPDFLLRLTLKAFRKHFGKEKFDLCLFVPPTESGSLVRNFAMKISVNSHGGQTLLCGERNTQIIEGFDLGNSPAEDSEENVACKSVVLFTTNGTKAIVKAKYSEKERNRVYWKRYLHRTGRACSFCVLYNDKYDCRRAQRGIIRRMDNARFPLRFLPYGSSY